MDPAPSPHDRASALPPREERRPRTPYLELLLVLGLSWIAIAAYGLSSEDVVIGGVVLAKADFGRELEAEAARDLPDETGATDHAGAASAGASAPLPRAPTAAPGARPIDRSPQRILLFGDSMVEVVQPRLADYCLENGHQLYPAIWYASTLSTWASGDELGNLLRELEPTMVIASLGSSELAARRIDERDKQVRVLMRRVGSRKFVWIGPPNWREDTGINAMLERTLGGGRFFRSAELTLPRGADGIHPNPEGGATWVDAFVNWNGAASAFPIALDPPTRVAPKLPARVFAPPR